MTDPQYVRELAEMLVHGHPTIEISALQYAGLIGNYVRMERDATPDEMAIIDEPTVGMECVVTSVIDVRDGVEIRGETHEVWTITRLDAHLWRWSIWDSETIRRAHKYRG